MHAISVAHRREKHVGYHIFYFFDPLRIREAFPGKTGFHPFRKNSVKLGAIIRDNAEAGKENDCFRT
jgi:hypothetical protein